MPHNVKTLIPNVTIYSAIGTPLVISDAGTTVTLDDASYQHIPQSAFVTSNAVPQELTADKTDNANAPYQGLYYSNTGSRTAYLQDLGPVGSSSSDQVSTQAAYVAADPALTSSAPAALTTTQTAGSSYTSNEQAMLNALKADLTALRTTLMQTQADLATLRTQFNAELSALQAGATTAQASH
jgi:hypothetical protein